jgi:hypothetical protein
MPMTDAARKVLEDFLALSEDERELVLVGLQETAGAPGLSDERDAELEAAIESVRAGHGVSLSDARRHVAARLTR